MSKPSPTTKSVAPSAVANLICSDQVPPSATSPSTVPSGASTRNVPALVSAATQRTV